MTKNKLRLIIISLFSVLVILLGLFVLWWQAISQLPAQTAESDASIDLGIVYLPVTPNVSAYYELQVASGALVTEVIAGSPADRAGVQSGDVILSFNGTTVDEKVPLYGMIRSCPPGNKIALEVWREGSDRIVEIVHVPN